jgi:hypothetical protein
MTTGSLKSQFYYDSQGSLRSFEKHFSQRRFIQLTTVDAIIINDATEIICITNMGDYSTSTILKRLLGFSP